ncbi:YitT family protein [Paenibacillus sp. J31TS4]|uniref:YitT family protein n=1 Tax=Paenibacillus sp. J31TS4 TaxID=2807195 RepID=UPI001BCBD3A7|nr:YitT family protein [Paenibacillus sp. J31TS4]
MMKKPSADLIRSLLLTLAGTAIYAFALQYFVIPNELMEGGLTGVALLAKYAANIPPSLTTLVLNIPLFVLGYRVFGKQAMAFTILGTLSLSLFLWVMETILELGWISPFRGHDYFLVTLYAGVSLGTGLGLVFRGGATTGGVDILARYLNKKRGMSMGQVILSIDVLVIGSSLFYISQEKVLYTMVVVFIASRLIDYITEGAYAAKSFTIVTAQHHTLAEAITNEMERGVTILTGRGAYSKEEKDVLYCVVARAEVRRLTAFIKAADPSAFIIISDVHDVLGEGFKTD